MKSILYIGNRLRNNSSNVSTIHILGELLSKEGYRLYFASSVNNKFLRLLDMVSTTLKRIRIVDVVIIDTYSTLNFYFAFIISQICRLFKKPYIPRLNGGNLPARLKSNPRMCAMIFDHAKYNVSPSYYLKRNFEEFGYPNVLYIPNALNIERYPLIKKSYASPKLLWVRSFSKIYNPKLAIEVFHELKKRYAEAELCMIGPDSDGTLKEVKAYANMLHLNVKFTGKLTKEEWINASQDYNIFINTTNYDNMPVSVIEAMALGFPIVSTNVGGMPDLIDDQSNGVLVSPDNAEDMVEAIETIIKDTSHRDKIMNNSRKKAETFDWKYVKQEWIDIL